MTSHRSPIPALCRTVLPISLSLSIFALPLAGLAQTVAAADTDWTEVPALNIRTEEPRFWKIRKGDAVIYVLGVPFLAPKALVWPKGQVQRRLAAAHVLVAAPQMQIGLTDLFGVMAADRASHLPKGQRLDELLPEDLKVRFHAALNVLGVDPMSAQDRKPSWAALILMQAFLGKSPVANGALVEDVEQMARKAHVRVETPARYNATPILRETADASTQDGIAMLRIAVETVEFSTAHADAIGKDWARGDLVALKSELRPDLGFTAVFLRTPTGGKLMGRSQDAIAKTISEALSHDAHAIAVVDISRLLQKGGAFDQLRAEGYLIEAPED